MKSAYELAMERLTKSAPTKTMTAEKKRQLAELDSVYKAKLAEREIALHADIQEAERKGDTEAAEKARGILAAERQKLAADLETKKNRVREQG